MTDERLKEIEERHAKARQGPWKWRKCYEMSYAEYEDDFGNEYDDGPVGYTDTHWALVGPEHESTPDKDKRVLNHRLVSLSRERRNFLDDPEVRLVEHSWEDILDLLAEVRRLRNEVAELRKPQWFFDEDGESCEDADTYADDWCGSAARSGAVFALHGARKVDTRYYRIAESDDGETRAAVEITKEEFEAARKGGVK